LGHIFLPLFVEVSSGETFEEAVDRTDYGNIWEVIQTLSEQDEDLYQLITILRQEKGETGDFNEEKIGTFIEIISDESINAELQNKVKKSISICVLSKVGSYWHEMFGRLLAFKKNRGYTNVPQDYVKDKPLARWADTQRQTFRKKELSQQKIDLLNAIHFDWAPSETSWNKMYKKLIDFKQEYGHTAVPRKCIKNKFLACWIVAQRRVFRNKGLSPKKIELLDAIHFDWDPLETYWNKMYQKLIDFEQEYGHTAVPHEYIKDKPLSHWVKAQRQVFKRKALSQQKIELLNTILFDWDPLETYWNTMYQKLVTFRKQYGHANVPQEGEKNKHLVHWVRRQRKAFKMKVKELSHKKIELLNIINFDWDPLETYRNTMYQKLVDFKQEHGHTNVPARYVKDKSLGYWLHNQRNALRKKHYLIKN
jgi:hypothetical protein